VEAPHIIRFALLRLSALALLCLLGCRHIGPRTIVQDRVAYNDAIANTWKEQTLLNIVKMRYFDTPFFVDVAQIVSGYSLAKTGEADLAVTPPLFPGAPFSNLLGAKLALQRAFIDRPTIAYAPQTNSKFIKNLTLPLPPTAVLYLMQAGYPVDLVFDLTLDSINGLRGLVVSGGQVLAASPEFRRVAQILRRAQLAGQVGMRIEVEKDKKESLIMFFRDPEIDPDLAADLNEARKLLRIKPDQRDLRVVFGAAPRAANEIAMVTRSPYRILGNLASFVQVPDTHLAEGRAPPLAGSAEDAIPRFTVVSGPKRPKDCFAATCYRGHWFWIDDRDAESKRTMMYLMVILALADVGAKETVPFLTIQVN
jgi:hypothetical protein